MSLRLSDQEVLGKQNRQAKKVYSFCYRSVRKENPGLHRTCHPRLLLVVLGFLPEYFRGFDGKYNFFGRLHSLSTFGSQNE